MKKFVLVWKVVVFCWKNREVFCKIVDEGKDVGNATIEMMKCIKLALADRKISGEEAKVIIEAICLVGAELEETLGVLREIKL